MHPNFASPIFMTAHDLERISHLAFAATNTMPDVSDFLKTEVARANVISADTLLPAVVRMGSDVTFRDETTGKVRRAVLVYPHEADLTAGKISVMTPVGAALIGLVEGSSIEWQTRTGAARVLRVLQVGPPTR